MPKVYFDERIAARYDADATDMFESAVIDPTVNFLADLASRTHTVSRTHPAGKTQSAGKSQLAGRPESTPEGGAAHRANALELGIGTGRIALPLSRRGIRVHGIDLSPAMTARLSQKPGADDIGVTIGDFATTKVGGAFQLVYLVFNTITNLTTQDEQVECFRNAAAHLTPGGCFVIEVEIPELQRLPPGETVRAFTVSPTRLGFDEYDVAAQILYSHHYWATDGKLEVFSAPYRYVWPAELDLMARIAGLSLRERWSDWNREPFTSDSTKHISVWEKPM